MLATAFDPLAAARDLKAAGFETEQAEALAAQLRFAAGADHADLATKADIDTLKAGFDALRSETKGDIAELRAATQADIAELENRLRSAIQTDIAELRAATQADIAELRAVTQSDIASLRTATQTDIAGLRAELGTVRWSVGLIAAFLFIIGLRVFGLI